MARRTESLLELCGRVRGWRDQTGGGRGHRVPDNLWEQAVRVAEVAGPNATARATGLSVERLKQRMQGKATPASIVAAPEHTTTRAGKPTARHIVKCEPARDAGFVALQLAPRPTGRHTTVELVGRHGERMRIEVQGELDLAGLVHAFQSRQS